MNAEATIEDLPPAALREALRALWSLPSPGPRNLFSAPEFERLRGICCGLHPKAPPGPVALYNALTSLGAPCRPPPVACDLALPPGIAAARLHAALEQPEIQRVHLCPLDRAERLPELTFGPNRIAKLAAAELEELVDLPRLKRVNASWAFDAKLLSEFTWLLIKETLSPDRPPEQRAIPLLFESLDRDWSAIEPHRGRFAPAVENALFAMLLAPWEDWVDTPNGWWRAFEVPWVYATDNDLFVRPTPPPSADALSWDYMLEDDGEEVFVDPNRVRLNADAASIPDWLTDRRWADLVTVKKSPLFQTPIEHFFVKAFLEEDADEFLAHITTIEAALLLPEERSGLTMLIARRVSALLGAEHKGKMYEHLYNVRCALVHGRKMEAIPGDSRLLARQLARMVVNALVEVALDPACPQSREEYLKGLR